MKNTSSTSLLFLFPLLISLLLVSSPRLSSPSSFSLFPLISFPRLPSLLSSPRIFSPLSWPSFHPTYVLSSLLSFLFSCLPSSSPPCSFFSFLPSSLPPCSPPLSCFFLLFLRFSSPLPSPFLSSSHPLLFLRSLLSSSLLTLQPAILVTQVITLPVTVTSGCVLLWHTDTHTHRHTDTHTHLSLNDFLFQILSTCLSLSNSSESCKASDFVWVRPHVFMSVCACVRQHVCMRVVSMHPVCSLYVRVQRAADFLKSRVRLIIQVSCFKDKWVSTVAVCLKWPGFNH